MWDDSDPNARRRALDASIIRSLPTVITKLSEQKIATLVKGVTDWNLSQWTKVLNSAAYRAAQAENLPDEVDNWVWWRYPIFSRYGWSTAEVCRAGIDKFPDNDSFNNQAAFQAKWVRRGLRFTGKKTSRRTPQLWDFVLNEAVPSNASRDFTVMTAWIPYEKSRVKP